METTKGKYKYDCYLTIGFPTAIRTNTFDIEKMGFDKEEWDKMTESDRQEELNLYLKEWAENYVEYSWV